MKLCVAVLLMVIGASNAEVMGNTQPGCKTDTEMSVKYYRNAWDPTAFWICEQKGVAASMFRCPDQLAWYDPQKKCVPWSIWVWEEPVYPPSAP